MSKLHAYAVLLAYGMFFWCMIPLWIVALLPGVHWSNKVEAVVSLAWAGLKGMCVIPFVLLAPFVVPVALAFTPRSADNLSGFWWPWGNDVSINGDRPEYWAADYTGGTYYSKYHPRSYMSRLIWLVLRNRASAVAQWLGHEWEDGEYDDNEHWGDMRVGRDWEGWTLNRRSDLYQLYIVKKLGPLCYRLNFGHKVWANAGDGRKNTMVVTITGSLLRWKGA